MNGIFLAIVLLLNLRAIVSIENVFKSWYW